MNRNELISKASYQVAKILVWNVKLFCDAKTFKDCVLAVCSIQFSDYQNNKQFVEEVRSIQLSDSSSSVEWNIYQNI
jgi:hypothetical protein